jgi:superfamily II DNA/RNA helicase
MFMIPILQKVRLGCTTAYQVNVLLMTEYVPSQLDTSAQSTQALIITPTRELAQNIQKAVMALGKHMNVVCHSSIGGTNIREDAAKVREGVHVVTGTIGRVNDLIQRKALRMDKIKYICLDDANTLLSHEFETQINKCGYTPRLFSVHQNI